MSTESTFGTWNEPAHWPDWDQALQKLWHTLAAQTNPDGSIREMNSGLSQRKHEICTLWKIFQWRQPKIILEIGVAQGGTFAAWCKLAPTDAVIIGIDRNPDDCRPRKADPVHPFIAQPKDYTYTSHGGGMYALADGVQRIFPIRGWSYEPHVMEDLKCFLQGKKIEFLFHDASHSADMARKDYDLYRPLMAPGSIMAFHDIQESKVPECNKSEWWAEVKRDGDYSAMMELRGSKGDDSMGIGILFL